MSFVNRPTDDASFLGYDSKLLRAQASRIMRSVVHFAGPVRGGLSNKKIPVYDVQRLRSSYRVKSSKKNATLFRIANSVDRIGCHEK